MSVTQTHRQVFQGGGQPDNEVVSTYTGSGRSDLSETLEEGGTREVDWPVDISRLVALVITASRDVVIKTNSSGSPDDTINVGPNNPYVWGNDMDSPLLLTADVVSIFVVIGAGEDCDLRALALLDATE